MPQSLYQVTGKNSCIKSMTVAGKHFSTVLVKQQTANVYLHIRYENMNAF